MGAEVIFPVHENYLNIAPYFPDINFRSRNKINIDYDCREITRTNEYTVIPFRYSNIFQKVPYRLVMRAKYDMVGADFNLWRELTIERNYSRENELKKILGIYDDEKFDFVCERYGNAGRKILIGRPTNRTTVFLYHIKGFTLLDWCGLIEQAEEIHTVHTSIHYLLEVLNVKKPPHIYTRKPLETSHSFYKYLFAKDYEWHS